MLGPSAQSAELVRTARRRHVGFFAVPRHRVNTTPVFTGRLGFRTQDTQILFLCSPKRLLVVSDDWPHEFAHYKLADADVFNWVIAQGPCGLFSPARTTRKWRRRSRNGKPFDRAGTLLPLQGLEIFGNVTQGGADFVSLAGLSSFGRGLARARSLGPAGLCPIRWGKFLSQFPKLLKSALRIGGCGWGPTWSQLHEARLGMFGQSTPVPRTDSSAIQGVPGRASVVPQSRFTMTHTTEARCEQTYETLAQSAIFFTGHSLAPPLLKVLP